MADHRRPRDSWWRRLTSRQARAVLSLGMLAAPVGVATMAAWSDTATVQSAEITTGTLDLAVWKFPVVDESGEEVEPGQEELIGQGGTFRYSSITIAGLTPGESIARPFEIRNAGSVDFTYNGTIASIDNELTSGDSGLQLQIYDSGKPSNSGEQALANRSGSCTGNSVLGPHSISTTAHDIHATAQTLAAQATRQYCVRISLPLSAPNSLQGKITELIIQLHADQVRP